MNTTEVIKELMLTQQFGAPVMVAYKDRPMQLVMHDNELQVTTVTRDSRFVDVMFHDFEWNNTDGKSLLIEGKTLEQCLEQVWALC